MTRFVFNDQVNAALERVAQDAVVREGLQQMQDDASAWAECLSFVREVLEGHGIDMSAVPPMMYSNAVNAAIWKARRGELPEKTGNA